MIQNKEVRTSKHVEAPQEQRDQNSEDIAMEKMTVELRPQQTLDDEQTTRIVLGKELDNEIEDHKKDKIDHDEATHNNDTCVNHIESIGVINDNEEVNSSNEKNPALKKFRCETKHKTKLSSYLLRIT